MSIKFFHEIYQRFMNSRFYRDDMFAQDSIDMLKASGIDFDKFYKDGIDTVQFGELMMMSGLVLTDDVKWLSFHSGYDFGYLLKTLTCQDLPSDEGSFMELLHLFFPCIFDIKVYIIDCLDFLFLTMFLVYDDCS